MSHARPISIKSCDGDVLKACELCIFYNGFATKFQGQKLYCYMGMDWFNRCDDCTKQMYSPYVEIDLVLRLVLCGKIKRVQISSLLYRGCY